MNQKILVASLAFGLLFLTNLSAWAAPIDPVKPIVPVAPVVPVVETNTDTKDRPVKKSTQSSYKGEIFVDGIKLVGVSPVIVNGRSMVPMRAIFEKFGASVSWDGVGKIITANKSSLNISMRVGNASASINGTPKKMNSASIIRNGQVLVPLRDVSNIFSCDVKFDNSSGSVIITSKSNASTSAVTEFEFVSNLPYANGLYTGTVGDNGRVGQGTQIYSNGDKYVGNWKDGAYDGQGTYTWANGAKYVGSFKNGVCDGQGTEFYANGSKYVGKWGPGIKATAQALAE